MTTVNGHVRPNVLVTTGGHAFDEPGILDALIRATDKFAGGGDDERERATDATTEPSKGEDADDDADDAGADEADDGDDADDHDADDDAGDGDNEDEEDDDDAVSDDTGPLRHRRGFIPARPDVVNPSPEDGGDRLPKPRGE